MNRNALKSYAPLARRAFIQAVTDRAGKVGLTAKGADPVSIKGDVAFINGQPFPKYVAEQRDLLEQRVARQGFDQVMEAVAYTWFNRFVAIRFMEIHGYIEHGFRVLSGRSPSPLAGEGRGEGLPEVLQNAEHVDFPGLNKAQVVDLKLSNKDEQLYRMLLIAQCNALHAAMPFLFERVNDETDLLLPDNLLHSDSIIRTLVSAIPEEDWQEVEVIGWLYQFYISEKKNEVIGKVVKSEDIPAATQLFTPNWIVQYLVQNSLGRQWMATYPDSPLKAKMTYYIEPAEQTPEVQAQLKAITPESLNPEALTLLDPACGSGHILVEAYELLKEIYLERGYRLRDIPKLILSKNLFGLEIDDRAAQLAAFALMMKARADDRQIFKSGVQPQVIAIQESLALNAREMAEALNGATLTETAPPSTYLIPEIEDDLNPLFSAETMAERGHIDPHDIGLLLDLFKHGKTFGSLIQIPPQLAEKMPELLLQTRTVRKYGATLLSRSYAEAAIPIMEQAVLLARKYDVIVANPPYMGNKYMNLAMKDFAAQLYDNANADVFAMFVNRSLLFCRPNGKLGFVVPYVWMFISSYESFRQLLLGHLTITSLVQLEYNAFEPACVPVCAMTLANGSIRSYNGDFIKLTEFKGHQTQSPRTLEAICNINCEWRFRASREDFEMIPGHPILYWIKNATRHVFKSGKPLGDIASPRAGLATGDNQRFQRYWHEVSLDMLGFGFTSCAQTTSSPKRWFPCNSGGNFRKWYGNNETVVDWQNDGSRIRNFRTPLGALRSRPQNTQFFFKPGITWTKLSTTFFAARLREVGFVFDDTGRSAFPIDESQIRPILAFMCSSVASYILNLLNPTMSYTSGDLVKLPVMGSCLSKVKMDVVDRIIQISRTDWDNFESSWNFATFPWLHSIAHVEKLGDCFGWWEANTLVQIKQMKELEAQNNSLFIEAYGLHGELSSEVPEEQITLARANREEDVERLISYAIGCMMGRYSLDTPGLIYAHSGNEGFDPSQYKTFPADADGIIPITDYPWFSDDVGTRFVEFISVAWPKEHLEENLTFVAESLGANKGESSRETLRRYLAQSFFKDHLRTYKKRPIYWLFSSGKQRAFQAIVYLHRYNEGTLARMRTEYVVPLQGKIAARIDHLDGDIEKVTSGTHRKKLEKEREILRKQQTELLAFDEKLRHYADKRITLDLDDGVKVNYGKFGDLLAEVDAVTGGAEE